MKAMIFAAGLGSRMMPLTANCPKPLLPLAGKPLIEYHLEKIADCGISDVVINVSYLADQIIQAIGDGSRWGLSIQYSIEPEPQETYGGLLQAQNLLMLKAREPLLLINADVYCDVDFANFTREACDCLREGGLGFLLMAKNPEHNLKGDFSLSFDNLDSIARLKKFNPKNDATFSGISVLLPALLGRYEMKTKRLSEMLVNAIQEQQLFATLHTGEWHDIGTPERLQLIENQLASQ